MNLPRTTILTVTYNSAGVIDAMLGSVPAGTPTVVVDNGSTDDTCARVASRKGVELREAGGNFGFGRGCNLAAEGVTTPYLMCLNPDARLTPGALEALEAAAEADHTLGAANPRIEDARGNARLKMSSILPHPDLPRPDINSPGEMPMLSGGALFLRRSVFEEVGGFDPRIFLYHEDHELCWRLREAGHTLWHLPQATVIHAAGTGSARSPQMAHWKGYQMARSRIYVLRKTGQSGAAIRTLFKAGLGLISPVNMFSKRRRYKHIGLISGALSARKDGGAFVPK